jgi:hypothetical protein
MKKTGAVFCVAAALVVLINASVWEGAASSSAGSDLPETGYYVATNSFPRNTVVDITNLENGKTIRAIVSAPLENPGLLAVLSKDAAGAIGLPGRSIGRVRMNQPADPVAFSHFTEGMSSSGDPDHDPAAFVAANGINPDLLVNEGSSSLAPQTPSGTDEEPPAAGTGITEAIGTGALAAGTVEAAPPADGSIAAAKGSGEETAAVPDKSGAESLEGSTIVDLPESYIPPVSEKPDEGLTPETNPELVWSPGKVEAGDEKLIEPELEDMAEVTDIITPKDTSEPAGFTEDPEKGDLEPGEALAEESPGPAEREDIFSGDYDLTMVPSKERPPESVEPVMPGDMVSSSGAGTGPAPTLPPARGEDSPSLLPGLADSAGAYGFPVPVITELEEGKYYLQLAASRNQDAVKTELAKIDEYWPLKIQVSERDNYPYRILVGPVNQGESRALLQRFKNSGYQNAFVRVKN